MFYRSDIDYMDNYKDYTNNPTSWGFTEGAAFLSKIHEDGHHYVPIVDAAIYHPFPNNTSDV